MKHTLLWLFLLGTPLSYSQQVDIDSLSIEFNKVTQDNLKADILAKIGVAAYYINFKKARFLTNSYKYAFGNNIGLIKVSIKDIGNNYELLLSDNGKGFLEDFDIKKSDSFGLRIMKLLSEQLDGSFALNSNNGLSLNIKFPK